MRTINWIKLAPATISMLLLSSCNTDDGPDEIFVYFAEKSVAIKEGDAAVADVELKVFATENLTSDVSINYRIEGEGAGRLEDRSGGAIVIPAGYSGYIEHIKLTAPNNDDNDGDTDLRLVLSSPDPRLVFGLGNNNDNASLQLNVIDDDFSCLVGLWSGALRCNDEIYPSYSPTACMGGVVDGDCMRVDITFNFWDYPSLPMHLKLELGEVDPSTDEGGLTLLEDTNAVGDGYDITFYKGNAGTYNAASGELDLVLSFTGYDIGGDGKYRFTVKK